MEKKTVGTVISVKKQWWLKVNTKPIRLHAFDGVVFPHIITVSYVVDGQEYTKKKWIRAMQECPKLNSQIAVIYRENQPEKCRLELD